MKKVTIQWLGHSCFKLTWDNWSAVVDPYQDGSVPGLDNLQVSAIDVFCSHGHYDHGAAEVVKQIKMAAPAPKITRVNSFHDNEKGTKRGENIIRVFDFDGFKVAHFGDLGHLLDDEQVSRIGDVDVALLPVGGFYTIDAPTAKEVARQVKAKVIIPMHYRTDKFGFDVIGTLDEFTKLYDDVVYTDSDTVVYVSKDDVKTGENTAKEAKILVLVPAMAK